MSQVKVSLFGRMGGIARTDGRKLVKHVVKWGPSMTILLICAAVAVSMVPNRLMAAITIPNTIDADALGTSALAALAPVIVSVIAVSMILYGVGLAVRAVRGGAGRVARSAR